MKKNILFWGLSLLTVVATGCSNEEVLNNSEANEPLKALNVSVENLKADSRIGFNTAGEFFWSEDDQLAVKVASNTDSRSEIFDIMTGTDKGPGYKTARFNAMLDAEYSISNAAAYPAKATEFAGSNVNITYPASYDITVDLTRPSGAPDVLKGYKNCNAVMAGIVNGDNLKLKHLGGYFLVRVDKMPTAAGTFIFRTEKEKISGKYSITEGALALDEPQFKLVDAANDAEKKVVINFTGATENQKAYFYVPVPAGTYEKVIVEFATAADKPATLSCSKYNTTVNRGQTKGLKLSSFIGQ